MFPSALFFIDNTTLKMLSYEELKKSGCYFRVHDDHSPAFYETTTGFTADDPKFMVDGKPISEQDLEVDSADSINAPKSIVNHISHGYCGWRKPSRWITVSKDLDDALWQSVSRFRRLDRSEVKISVIRLDKEGHAKYGVDPLTVLMKLPHSQEVITAKNFARCFLEHLVYGRIPQEYIVRTVTLTRSVYTIGGSIVAYTELIVATTGTHYAIEVLQVRRIGG
jgi:hypothetical protein